MNFELYKRAGEVYQKYKMNVNPEEFCEISELMSAEDIGKLFKALNAIDEMFEQMEDNMYCEFSGKINYHELFLVFNSGDESDDGRT